MKTNKILSLAFAVFAIFTIISCEKENENTTVDQTSIIPDKFKVDIPSSISQGKTTKKSGNLAAADTFQGAEIYRNLRVFIFVGEGAGDLVAIFKAIKVYNINKPMSLSFSGDDDQRAKNLVVKENQSYNGKMYKFQLTITDVSSSTQPDSGKALQVFWNTKPVEGVAIIKPYNCDRIKEVRNPDLIYRIEYSEVANANYDAHMIVEIDRTSIDNAEFAMSALKMFVGKKGNRVDVYGNSEHPNARFFTNDKGFSWAFVGSGYTNENIGVAEVGLPPMGIDNADRNTLLVDYSIKNVLTSEINKWFEAKFGFKPDSTSLSGYLKNADAPGYFSNNGFVQAGISPNNLYNELDESIKKLVPFNPKDIKELAIDFK